MARPASLSPMRKLPPSRALFSERRKRRRLCLVCIAVPTLALLTLAGWSSASHAQTSAAQAAAPNPGSDWREEVRQLIQAQPLSGNAEDASASGQWRVEVEVGELDPRLKLAPCSKIEPFLPSGMPRMGRTRVGLRCLVGEKRWSVTLPITVAVFGPAVVAEATLAAGTVLQASHLTMQQVDWASPGGQPYGRGEAVIGRTLARPVHAGQALRSADLRQRQYFSAGEPVRVLAQGDGWQVASQGQALGPGLEGAMVRVKLDSGRIAQGRASGPGLVEVMF